MGDRKVGNVVAVRQLFQKVVEAPIQNLRVFGFGVNLQECAAFPDFNQLVVQLLFDRQFEPLLHGLLLRRDRVAFNPLAGRGGIQRQDDTQTVTAAALAVEATSEEAVGRNPKSPSMMLEAVQVLRPQERQ
jgi:hypothetical protein